MTLRRHLNPIPPARLGRIQGLIGPPQQIIEIRIILAQHCDTNRHRQPERQVPLRKHRPFHRLPQPLAGGMRAIGIDVVKQHHELFTALARRQFFRAPAETITSLQQCVHCGQDIALLNWFV